MSLVDVELFPAVGESESDGFGCLTPRCCSVCSVSDLSLGFGRAKREMCLTNASLPVLIDLSADNLREEIVEVEC